MKGSKYFIGIFLLLFTHVAMTPVFADDISEPTPTSYDLTHPGLLPDHPFYFLKVARDNVMSFFKGEPIDKATFALLQADKHLSASHALLTQKQNPELASVSLTDAQNYLEESIRQTAAAKKEGMDIAEMHHKLYHAIKKQKGMLGELEKQFAESDKKKFKELKNRVEALDKVTAGL
jgi:hypothetical protein